jgi:hypothetical protein
MEAESQISDPEGSPPKPRPLKFAFVIDDGREVTYRAFVGNNETTAVPIFALTVITASPQDAAEQHELLAYLGNIMAGFAIAKAGGTSAGLEPVPFYPGTDVLIIPELVSDPTAGVPDVEFAITGIIGKTFQPGPGVIVNEEAKGPIKRRNLLFTTAGGPATEGTVECKGGALTVVHPRPNRNIGTGHHHHYSSTTWIKMHGDDDRNSYYIHGNFYLQGAAYR